MWSTWMRGKETERRSVRTSSSYFMFQGRETTEKQMVRRMSSEDEETNHAGLPMEEWRMKAQRVFW